MKKNDQQFAVLGLGIFGATVAQTLAQLDCEVIAIDRDMAAVQKVADDVESAIQGDITNKNVLRDAGVGDCDVAIVATGSNLEVSILCILALKDLGVGKIIAKSTNKRYNEVLQKVGADRVILPEMEMGKEVARSLLSKRIVDVIDLDEDYSITEIDIPSSWVGKTLLELSARKKYHINVLGVRPQDGKLDVAFSPDYRFKADDHIVFIAQAEDFEKFISLD